MRRGRLQQRVSKVRRRGEGGGRGKKEGEIRSISLAESVWV